VLRHQNEVSALVVTCVLCFCLEDALHLNELVYQLPCRGIINKFRAFFDCFLNFTKETFAGRVAMINRVVSNKREVIRLG
jgi:hypothetical protein